MKLTVYEIAMIIVIWGLVAAYAAQTYHLRQAEARAVPDVNLSWKGWRASVLRYEKTRAPDEHYSLKTHQEASELFREGVRERYTTQTVHWSAVRLICETMKMTVFYTQQEQNRHE